MKALRHTLLLFALPAGLLALAPGALLYDRVAIMQGEWWRLWTGHWAHFSFSHLAWNLAVLLAAGTWLEKAHPGLLWRYVMAGAPLIALGSMALAPEMHTYGGLSGLATGVVVLLALVQFETQPAERGWWIAVLLLTGGKIAADAISPVALFSRFNAGEIQVSVLAHVLGALFALPAFLSRRFAGRAMPAAATP